MQTRLRAALGAGALLLAAHASAQITFYEGEGFRGGAFRADQTIPNFAPMGFNDRAASAIVEQGRWEVCSDAGFRGRCAILIRARFRLPSCTCRARRRAWRE